MIELCYFSFDQWEIRIHLLWGKCFNIPHHCDPHLNQTKFNDLFPLTIDGVLIADGSDKDEARFPLLFTIFKSDQGDHYDRVTIKTRYHDDQGDQGNQSEEGDQGEEADQGEEGDQGDQGYQGDQGDQGDQQGDQGWPRWPKALVSGRHWLVVAKARQKETIWSWFR